MKTLYIVIGCDTDPDRRGFIDGVPSDGLTWRGMLEGIPLLKHQVAELTDHCGAAPVFTWLLRVDEQIRRVHGSYAWVLRHYKGFLADLEQSGDELGWHPHFWRYDESAQRWYQEAYDVEWQIDMLRSAHADYQSELPGRARSVRMGWDYHNPQTYNTLEELGVTVEFSAIPGMRTQSGLTRKRAENLFDWYMTPRHPYYPSRADYRRPAGDDETPSTLMEAPNFVSPSRFWGLLSGLQLARKMKDPKQVWQAIHRPTFWINVTGRPDLFRPIAAALGNKLNRSEADSELFITYFHPDELLPNNSSLYSLDNVVANLESVLTVSERLGIAVEFARAERIPEIVSAQRTATSPA